jgi:hypothetical protein
MKHCNNRHPDTVVPIEDALTTIIDFEQRGIIKIFNDRTGFREIT